MLAFQLCFFNLFIFFSTTRNTFYEQNEFQQDAHLQGRLPDLTHLFLHKHLKTKLTVQVFSCSDPAPPFNQSQRGPLGLPTAPCLHDP